MNMLSRQFQSCCVVIHQALNGAQDVMRVLEHYAPNTQVQKDEHIQKKKFVADFFKISIQLNGKKFSSLLVRSNQVRQ